MYNCLNMTINIFSFVTIHELFTMQAVTQLRFIAECVQKRNQRKLILSYSYFLYSQSQRHTKE